MYKLGFTFLLVVLVCISLASFSLAQDEPKFKIFVPFASQLSNIDVYCLWPGPGITDPFPICPTIKYQREWGSMHETEGVPYFTYKPVEDQPVEFDSVKLLRYDSWDNMYSEDLTINPRYNLKSWKELDSWSPDKSHTIFLCDESSYKPTLIVGEFNEGAMFPDKDTPYIFGVKGIDCP